MDQTATSRQQSEDQVLHLLQKLKMKVYNDSNDQLALVLGRPIEEVEAWFDGSEEIDEDAELKIRRLADERLGGDDSGPEAASDSENIQQRL